MGRLLEPEEPDWRAVGGVWLAVLRAEATAVVTWLAFLGALATGLGALLGVDIDPAVRGWLGAFSVVLGLFVLGRLLLRAGWVAARRSDDAAVAIRRLRAKRLSFRRPSADVTTVDFAEFFAWRRAEFIEGTTIKDLQQLLGDALAVVLLKSETLTSGERSVLEDVVHEMYVAKVIDRDSAGIYRVRDPLGLDVLARLDDEEALALAHK